MNIQYITVALEHAREQLLQAKKKLDANNRIRAHRCCHIRTKGLGRKVQILQSKTKGGGQEWTSDTVSTVCSVWR